MTDPAMTEARRLLRDDELKAVEIHRQMPGSVHACPPWIADRIAESRAREGELVAVLDAQKAAHDYRFGPDGPETGEEMNAFMLKAQELDETAWQLTRAALPQGKKEPCPTCKGSRVVRSKGKQKNRLLSCPDCRESP